MALEERERATSGNPSDDSTQEATSGTPNRPPRWRFLRGNNNYNSTTHVHRQDENRYRIENQEEEETPPVIAGEEECNDDDQPLPPAVSRHVCKYCGEGFSTGWALGGHKRIHGIKNKKGCHDHGSLNLDKTKEKPHEEYACNVCPMKFPSPGALYSHMRMHPERPKMGMKPPSEQPSPRHRPEKESRGGCDDLLNRLVAKVRMSGRDDWKDIVDDEEAMGAVLGLLMLSQDTSFRGSCNLNKDRKIENSKRMKKGNYSDDKGEAKTVDESKCSDSDTDDDDEYVKEVGKCSKRKRHYLSRDKKIKDPERMRIVKKGNGDYSDEKGKAKMVESKLLSDSDTDDDDYMIMEAKCSKRKRGCLRSRGLRIEQSYVDDRGRDTITPRDRNSIVPSPSTSWLEKYESSAAKKKRYECSTCDRRFTSKQGLGGHMGSSGHKIKARAEAKTPLIGNEDCRHGYNDSSNNNVDTREDHDVTSLLTALSCNNQDLSEISDETIGEEGNNTRKNVPRFDLNELPSMEVDEEHS